MQTAGHKRNSTSIASKTDGRYPPSSKQSCGLKIQRRKHAIPRIFSHAHKTRNTASVRNQTTLFANEHPAPLDYHRPYAQLQAIQQHIEVLQGQLMPVDGLVFSLKGE
jgi:hypothetical protein